MTFHLAPDTEAPANMNVFLPGLATLYMADNALQCFHNVYPLRGAEVRDANAWARYLDEARHRFAGAAEVACHGHNWPVWGSRRIDDYLGRHRDMFKLVHDQTVRLMNKGYAAAEIAEAIEVPSSLALNWSTREYYGTISHNAKAVYQRYLGWYDGNPANLAPLPPVERARKMIAYMGGADAVLAKARTDFEAGEYRWVADAMSQLVQAEPGNNAARALGADALEQLGYQTESATWRNAYLMGALELRQGTQRGSGRPMVSHDVVAALSPGLMLDYLATSLDAGRAGDRHIVVNWRIGDTGERFALNLQHGAVTWLGDWENPQATATVTLDKAALGGIVTGRAGLDELEAKGAVRLVGDKGAVAELLGLVDTSRATFALIEPRPAAPS
jgi:alkyl sulfatase BDS1-like metallo-beta-lactamase superfamily hydrolase